MTDNLTSTAALATVSEGALPHQGLSARHLSLGYPNGGVIVDTLDVNIMPHGITAIVGPNACGKSTLLKALCRVLRPARGSVLLDGLDIYDFPSKEFAKKVGFLPQSAAAPEGISVIELVSRGRYPYLSLLRQPSAQDRQAVRQAMERTGVAELAERRVSELSGGQRQRVWIALALAQQTDILLLDEPTTFLDLTHQVEILELCYELNSQLGTTIVTVLHDLNQACRYADEIIAMKQGKIVAQGEPSTVITAASVRETFGLDVRIIDDPVTGTPLVLPLTGSKKTARLAATR